MSRTSSTRTSSPVVLGKKEATHARILGAASRAMRRRGLNGVAVVDVMKDAGLTHGGFYAHFESREALLAESLSRTAREMEQGLAKRVEQDRSEGASPFRAMVERYLSDSNLPAFDTACPVSALASELARCAFPARRTPNAVQRGARDLVTGLMAGVRNALPEGVSVDSVPAIASTLVGALQLARTLGSGPEAKAVLVAARTALLSQYEPHSVKA